MSKTKVTNVVEEYSGLKDQLLTNVQHLVNTSGELNELVSSLLKPTEEPEELTNIKKEWMDSSKKIDNIESSIVTLNKEKKDILKKIDAIVKKKGKTTAAQNKSMSNLTEEWEEVSKQIGALNTQLDTYSKERAKQINKFEKYFSKLDSKKEVKPKKVPVKGKKAVATKAKTPVTKKADAKKEVAKKVPAKKEAVKKEPVKKEAAKKVPAKKNTKAKKDDKESTTEQIKLKLDSDSDSDTSESDTDSELSSIESESSDSDSDSSSSEEN